MQLLRVCFLFGLCAIPLNDVLADQKLQEKAAAPEVVQDAANDDGPLKNTGKRPIPADDREAKEKKALAGFMMLALVCVVFLFFILAIAVVSSRFRKEVSRPLSKSQQNDPLWYLKNPPNDDPPSSTLLTEQPE